MCQLFGMSTRTPVRVRFRWERFASQGAAAGNPDGWGVAYGGGDVQVLREPVPAVDSELVRFLAEHGPLATTVVSHVRRATQGGRILRNTQPYARVLGGFTHVFAHNGHVPLDAIPESPWLRPVGDTDSEALFCLLLSRLEPLWHHGVPPLESRCEVISEFACEMRRRGAVNFLYFDGLTMFAHAHRRTILGEGVSTDPGLYMTLRPGNGPVGPGSCVGMDCDGPAPEQTLIATVPIDNGIWEPMEEGALVRLEQGRVV